MSFLFLALVAILFSRAEPFSQFLISCIRGSFVQNYFEMGPLALEKMSFKEFFLFLALAAILFSRADPF